MTIQQGRGADPKPLAEDGTVNFFGVRGKIEEGKRLIAGSAGSDLAPLGHTESVIGFVLASLFYAGATGQASRIASIEIDPLDAVILYLEGQLPPQQLALATVHDDRIDVPSVAFATFTVTVSIREQQGRAVAVKDAMGNRLYGVVRAYYH
jgi:hypothetical protein